MDSFLNHLDPHVNLSLFSLLHPKQDLTQYSSEENQKRLRLICNTALFSEMRENKIPLDFFSLIEEKENKKFETLRKKYTKVLKAIENKKFSSLNKKFISSNKHTKDLHFSQENFTLLFRISRGFYNRGKYQDSLRILQMLSVVFEDEIQNKMEFYWAKVFSYTALVLKKGSTALGSNMSGAKKRFRKDRGFLWEEILEKEKKMSTFNLSLQKEVNNLKMRFFHLKIVLDYVMRKKHLLGRNKADEGEQTPEKKMRKKSRRKSTRKMTHQTQEEEEPEHKESEMIEFLETEKMGKCLSLMLKDIGLANFDWTQGELRNMLAYIFVLEVNIENMRSLRNMSRSTVVKGFKEMWFYVQDHAENKMAIFSFLEALFVGFDFKEAAGFLKNVMKEIESNWMFMNYKGEIYNQLLKMFVIVYQRVTEKVDEEFLGNLLNIEKDELKDLLKTGGNQANEVKEVQQTQVEKLKEYLVFAENLHKKLEK